jgi:phosphoribosylformylglycinamidine (FGAM) synthase-like enzyme
MLCDTVEPEDLEHFEAICRRERCPYAVVGTATDEKQLRLSDAYFDNMPVISDIAQLKITATTTVTDQFRKRV